LLAKSPENRFGSAAEVRKHLRDLAIERAAPPAPSDVGESLAEDSVAPESTTFIGREQEIGRLRKNLEERLWRGAAA
jgi:hypothetical protein